MGVSGLRPATFGDVKLSLTRLRRAAGLDGGHRNDEYLALYAALLTTTGDEHALEHAYEAGSTRDLPVRSDRRRLRHRRR